MKAFPRFMARPAGRWLRIGAGAALVVGGVLQGGAGGIVLAIVGLVPLAAGSTDVCVFGPLFGAPARGRDVRSQHGA